MKSLDLALAQRRADIARQQERFKEMGKLIKATKLGKAFAKLLQYEPRAECMVYEYSVYIDVPVRSMKHMTEALEFFQTALSVEFVTTTDYPASGTREFSTGYALNDLGFCLVVRALISGNEADATATCKRIQTGVKTVEQPIWEIQCDEQLAVA